MRWGGDSYQKTAQALYEDSGQIHPAIRDKPTLRGDCIRYYDAYRHLGVSRLWTKEGPQPIQISEIKSLLDIFDIKDPYTRMKYVRFIKMMDAVEIKYHRANRR